MQAATRWRPPRSSSATRRTPSGGIRVEQVRGWQNREPSPDAAAVFEAFVAGMRDGSLPMDRAALEATPAARLMHRQRITAGVTPG